MQKSPWVMTAILGLLLAACSSLPTAPTPEVRQALAPNGKLRVGLILGAPVSVVRDSATGEMKGVLFDLGREFARRIDVPFEPVVYPSIGALLEGAKSGEWDIASFGVNPERAKKFDFTAPILEFEFGYLVPGGSSIATLTDVDRPGVRVGVPENGATDAVLTRTLKSAALIRTPGLAAGLEMLKSGRVDVFSTNKGNLFEMSDQLPGSKVLAGRFATDPIAMAIPKGRNVGAAYAGKFIEDAKHQGQIKAAIKRAGLRGTVEE